MDDKQCRICGETKPLGAFPVARTCRDGRRNECNTCNAKKARAWYAKHHDRQAETMANRAERLKASGLCVTCGQYRAVSGRVLCRTCSEKQRVRAARRYREIDTTQRRERTAERYHQLKTEGTCPHCRKRPVTPGPRGGMSHCDECRAEKRRWRDVHREQV